MGVAARVVLVLCAALVATVCGQTGREIDLYFVIDGSGSISNEDSQCAKAENANDCMDLFANFANATLHEMANLAGGFYQNEIENGVRAAVILFKCDGAGGPKILLPPDGSLVPTGNLTEINQGLTRVANVRPDGGTCSSKSLAKVHEMIDASPSGRKSSVLYVTDGEMSSKESRLAKNQAEGLRAPLNNQSAVFGLGVGLGRSGKSQVAGITGDEDKVWNVGSATALEEVIKALTSFIFGDFRLDLVDGRRPEDVCQGERPALAVSGSSVDGLQGLRCGFFLPGLGGEVETFTEGGVENGTWSCNFPDSFYSSAQGEPVEIQLYSVESEGRNTRKVGSRVKMVLGRKSCLAIESLTRPEGRCFGERAAYDMQGETMTFFGASGQDYTYECEFSLSGNGQTFTHRTPGQLNPQTGQSIQCALAADSTSFLADPGNVAPETIAVIRAGGQEESLPLLEPFEVSDVRVVAKVVGGGTVPGYADATEVAIERLAAPSTKLLLDSPACLQPDVSTNACWRKAEDATASFTGVVADVAQSLASLSKVCLVSFEGAAAAHLVDAVPKEGGGFSCQFPDEFVEPNVNGTKTQQIVTDLFLMDSSVQPARVTRVSSFFQQQRPFTFSGCVRVRQEAETCFGEAVTVDLESTRGVPLEAAQGVSCVFEDRLNGIAVTGQLAPRPGSEPSRHEYVCDSPETTGAFFGVTFDLVSLQSNGVPVVQAALSNTSTCFSVLVRNGGESDFTPLGAASSSSSPDLAQCWRSPRAGSTLRFQGKTPLKLAEANEEVRCTLRADATLGTEDVVVVARKEQGALLCDVPQDLFSGYPGEALVTFDLHVVPGQETNFTDPVRLLSQSVRISVDPCMEVQARNGAGAPLRALGDPAADFDFDQCWFADADQVTLFFSGATAQSMIAEGGLTCVLDGARAVTGAQGAVRAATVQTPDGFSCDVPAAAVFQGLGGPAAADDPFTVALELASLPRLVADQVVRLRSNTAAPCLEYEVLPTNPVEHVCMGTPAELVVSGGSSLDALLAQFAQAPSQDCLYVGGGGGHPAAAGQSSNGTVRCPMPLYSAFPKHRVDEVLPAGVARLILSEYDQTSSGEECLKTVIAVDPQTEDRRRALQGTTDETYCLGDRLSTSFAGQSVQFLISEFDANGLHCEWAPLPSSALPFASSADVVTTPAQVSGNDTLTCVSPVWSPWTVAGLAQGAYKSVQLKVESGSVNSTVDEPALFDGGYAPKVCSDHNDWGADTPAADADCMRGRVQMGLTGRSAIVLKSAPAGPSYECWGDPSLASSAVVCQASRASDGGLELFAPAFSADKVSCEAPGWAPDRPDAGNYTAVRLSVCVAENNSTHVVKQSLFAPTAARKCLGLAQSAGCPGKPIDLSLQGATLSAYDEFAKRKGVNLTDVAKCHLDGGAVSRAPNSPSTTRSVNCFVTGELDLASFVEKDYAVRFSLEGLDQDLHEETVRVGVLRDRPQCARLDNGASACGTELGNNETAGRRRLRALQQTSEEQAPASATEAYIAGDFVAFVVEGGELDHVQCVFENPGVQQSRYVSAQSDASSGKLFCKSDGFFTSVSINFRGIPLLSASALETIGDPAPCLALLQATQAPTEKEGDDAGLIAGVVVAVLFLVCVVAFLVVRKRNREAAAGLAEDPADAKKAAAAAAAAGAENPAEPLLHAFGVGDRVEAFGNFDPEALGEDKAWFKGTVSEDNLDGTFTIALDAISGGMTAGAATIVAAADLRTPLSDFKVGDLVEARHGGAGMWYAAMIDKVLVNNAYDLTYEDTDELGQEQGVPGELIRAPVMIFQPTNLVEVRSAQDGRWERATVRAVDITAQQYTLTVASSLVAKPGEEEPEDEVLVAKAEDVRAFVPVLGELMDVHFDECESAEDLEDMIARATVTKVNLDDTTCEIEYVDEFAGDGKEYPTVVPWYALYRPFFRLGEQVEVKNKAGNQPQATEVSANNTNSPKAAHAWLPAKITGVDAANNSYAVQYDDGEQGEESGVPVSRIRSLGLFGTDLDGQTFSVGQAVKVCVGEPEGPEDAAWYKAEITAANDDGTYDITYLGGPCADKKESRVSVHRIRELDEVDDDDIDVRLAESPYGNIFRPPPRDHSGASENDGLQVPFHLRFRRKKPLDFVELPGNQFEVKLDMSEGLGLSLGWTKDNRVIVAGFRDLPNGDWGPVEACGLVGLKDQLIRVNDDTIHDKSFVEVSELIKNSGKTIRLQFGRAKDDEMVGVPRSA